MVDLASVRKSYAADLVCSSQLVSPACTESWRLAIAAAKSMEERGAPLPDALAQSPGEMVGAK